MKPSKKSTGPNPNGWFDMSSNDTSNRITPETLVSVRKTKTAPSPPRPRRSVIRLNPSKTSIAIFVSIVGQKLTGAKT